MINSTMNLSAATVDNKQHNEVLQSVLEFAAPSGERVLDLNTPNSYIDTETTEFNVDEKSNTSSRMMPQNQAPLQVRLERIDREVDILINRRDKPAECAFWLAVCICAEGILTVVAYVMKESNTFLGDISGNLFDD